MYFLGNVSSKTLHNDCEIKTPITVNLDVTKYFSNIGRSLLAKVIQFLVSPEKCKNQRYKFLTPDQLYALGAQKRKIENYFSYFSTKQMLWVL